MRVCVVGNGPSAEGKGDFIDACDFVVRLKDFWRCGAEGAGTKTSAHAYFGWWNDWPDDPRNFEHWWTHCPDQIRQQRELGRRRLQFVNERAAGGIIRWLTNAEWYWLQGCLQGGHPSTGFVAIAMALTRYPNARELVLHGFDSTTPERPHFFDAREEGKESQAYKVEHEMLREKRAIAEMHNGLWLGEKRDIKLTWPDMPDLGK